VGGKFKTNLDNLIWPLQGEGCDPITNLPFLQFIQSRSLAVIFKLFTTFGG